MLDSRLVRYQFRQTGLVHLATCADDNEAGYHVIFGPTICGKRISVGSGGWGFGPKRCEKCWAEAAPAERASFWGDVVRRSL